MPRLLYFEVTSMNIIKLLKSYVKNKQLNMDISDSDIKVLKEQSLQTILYPLTKK